jgi:hypothetical protein
LGHLGLRQLRLAVLLEQFHQQVVGTVQGLLQELLLEALAVQEEVAEEVRAALETKVVTPHLKELAAVMGEMVVVVEVALEEAAVLAGLLMVVMAESVLLALLTQTVLAKAVIQHQEVEIILLAVGVVVNTPERMGQAVLAEEVLLALQEQAERITLEAGAVEAQAVRQTLEQEQAAQAAPVS